MIHQIQIAWLPLFLLVKFILVSLSLMYVSTVSMFLPIRLKIMSKMIPSCCWSLPPSLIRFFTQKGGVRFWNWSPAETETTTRSKPHQEIHSLRCGRILKGMFIRWRLSLKTFGSISQMVVYIRLGPKNGWNGIGVLAVDRNLMFLPCQWTTFKI